MNRGTLDQGLESYDVGADLTAENCVLGDHDDDFQVTMKEDCS